MAPTKYSLTPTQRTEAGMHFPIARVHRDMKQHTEVPKTSKKAAVYMTGVMEFLTMEIFEMSSNHVAGLGKVVVKPDHVKTVLNRDAEFRTYLHAKENRSLTNAGPKWYIR
ncbi:histone-fold-containing protein [Hesseltinella vesiculosa]|uniref:Histone H2A n=1 Tax=Hesseltinella vesiculosa TaxID=101127 RepID=A0A1X2GRH3_9FUNG|nr:histone-fold-containing protein [Hesseltinella vesiculosa]